MHISNTRICSCVLLTLLIFTVVFSRWQALAEERASFKASKASLATKTTKALVTITVANTNDSGAGSLRDAINQSNASVGTFDTIVFNLGAGTPTINLLSGLPVVTDPVTINGNSGGANRVELNGAGIGSPASGLNIEAGGTTIEGLVINRFDGIGIAIYGSGGNVIKNCYIGTDSTGAMSLGNTVDGVNINYSPNNTIGGTTAGERNVISGNGYHGVSISGELASGNKVIGNYLGTSANGTTPLGNTYDGVSVSNAPNNTIGGATAGERNIISANGGDGLVIAGGISSGNKVLGNYIGTDANGTAVLGNFVGLRIADAPNNIIGGATAGERNIISGNRSTGVNVSSLSATGNKITGNYIGTDVTGTVDLGNAREGVYCSSSNNTIGGAIAGERNVISGNNGNGVSITSGTASGNKVIGNYLGTDATGTAGLGNSSHGVAISSAPNNTVGGASTGERNVIAGNNSSGVSISGATATGNKVTGNYIGTDVNGTTSLGNSQAGVVVSSSNNMVGGMTASERNLIAGNDSGGINVRGQTTTGNALLGNAIFNNTGLGISLISSNPFLNDPLDEDTGTNGFQNFPVLSCAVSANGVTTIQGTLNSLATTSFRLEFFLNDACDTSGHGEGQTFLGFQHVTTDGSGDATIAFAVGQTIAAGKFITATATRLDGMGNPVETSEFSACRVVAAPTLTVNNVSQTEGQTGTTNFIFTVTLSGAQNSCLPVTLSYATANGTATAGNDYSATSGTLTFAAPHASNAVTKAISVSVSADEFPEANETFFVNLSGATNATMVGTGPSSIGFTAAPPGIQGIGTIQNDDQLLTASLSDPLACAGPGDVVNGSMQMKNPADTPQAFTLTTTFTNLVGLPNTCVVTGAQAGVMCAVTASGLTASGTAPAHAVINVQFQGQIADSVSGGTVTTNSTAVLGLAIADSTIASLTVNCPSAGPGLLPNSLNQISDQKPGSLLMYPIFTSDAANAAAQNARLSITNTNPSRVAYVHLFFVDGSSCSVADSYLCLTPNQTAAILASDIDPGSTGYVIAVATDSGGCPTNFNYLIGDEYVKFASGHEANLGAESIAALAGGLTACDAATANAVELKFDGLSYNALPRVLAASSLPSRADNNDTMLIVNRLGGSLIANAATLGTLFGILYDDAEKAFSFSLTSATCQSRGSLSNDRPRLVPRYEQIIGSGRSGWLKISGGTDIGIFGAQINRNVNAGSNASAFNQGHNLHKLTLTATQSITIPVFPPTC